MPHADFCAVGKNRTGEEAPKGLLLTARKTGTWITKVKRRGGWHRKIEGDSIRQASQSTTGQFLAGANSKQFRLFSFKAIALRQ
ncbi:MAG: hypothetical protein COA71_00395 [SAR86 cluster bacterium]|uniref:Uncharacterized protein n=1 Tax=SAR86 cluster bacterium TaxID=2030880 RepID=A0A2A5CHK4_9GAMM|nr:MAG: hypothetical protein COA71_00395 [SAR86 cluster bacterium]